eukprot:gb/GECG01000395.1/.p1 GENE.gb/GECG01000395.1/~~gb/GECG01000395.1/.p1  ORF type:complete len:261 (+),score=25.93 gb/GECG01000395.1/:1-783(+)
MSTASTYQYQPSYDRVADSGREPITVDEQRRRDGRLQRQIREPSIQLGVNSQASGSAYVELGSTKVLCVVHGPRGITKAGSEFSERGALECDVKFSAFAQLSRRENRGQDDDEKKLSRLVGQALEPSVQLDILEKSVVDVHTLVIEDNGGCLDSSIIAASLALCDAGIPVYDLVPSCSVAIMSSVPKSSDALILDPLRYEVEEAWCHCTVAMMPLRGHLTLALHSGSVPSSKASTCMQLAMHGAASIYDSMKSAIKHKHE